MRSTRPTLAGLACFATLASSATISWSGSGSIISASAPYSSCNETTGGPTSLTGTISATISLSGSGSTKSTSTPYSSCNETTTTPTSPTGTSITGTTKTGTGVTGTGPYTNATGTTQCLATSSAFVTTTTFIPPNSFVSTETFIGNGPIIDGDTLTPVNGTATATVTATTTSIIAETTTTTEVIIAATTIGNPLTITVPPPTGFLPIQSTLPNATYDYQNPCKVVTTTSTYTDYIFLPSYSETVLTGTVIAFYSEQQTYEASSFTNYLISYVTSFVTTSSYTATATTTTDDGLTNTFTATTATVYQACATNNFADSVVMDHTAIPFQFFDYNIGTETFSGAISGIDTPYDCCNYAFSKSADIWTFGIGLGCAIITAKDGVCDQAAHGDGDFAELGSPSTPFENRFVLGNAPCGKFTASQ